MMLRLSDKAEVALVPPAHVGNGAVVSDDGVYRYALWRVWDPHAPVVLFVMLNPSTADASSDDATIRKCRGFAALHNYGGFLVGNLFAWRATQPRDLPAHDIAVGVDNDLWLRHMATHAACTIVAWGAASNCPRHSRASERASAVAVTLSRLHCLGVTKDSAPMHPLYQPYSAPVQPWIPPERTVVI